MRTWTIKHEGDAPTISDKEYMELFAFYVEDLKNYSDGGAEDSTTHELTILAPTSVSEFMETIHSEEGSEEERRMLREGYVPFALHHEGEDAYGYGLMLFRREEDHAFMWGEG
jgi:hypothetical protein